MIWTHEELEKFMKFELLPPEKEPTGFGKDNGMRFIDALAISIDPKFESNLLFDALIKKYPEAVESHLQKAKDLLKESGKKKRL